MTFEILAANQIVVTLKDNTKYLISYNSCVAKKKYGDITLFKDWDYSRTTTKYVAKFLNLSPKEIRLKLDIGEIKYAEQSDL